MSDERSMNAQNTNLNQQKPPLFQMSPSQQNLFQSANVNPLFQPTAAGGQNASVFPGVSSPFSANNSPFGFNSGGFQPIAPPIQPTTSFLPSNLNNTNSLSYFTNPQPNRPANTSNIFTQKSP